MAYYFRSILYDDRPRDTSLQCHTSWNSLPDRLRDPTLNTDSFRGNYLKCGIICELLSTLSAVEMLHDSAMRYKFTMDVYTGILLPTMVDANSATQNLR